MFTPIWPAVLVIANAVARFHAALQWNPLAFVFTGAPLAQWRSALAPASLDPLTALDPLFYPLWLSGIARITTGTALGMGVYAGVLSVVTPWVWYRFFREVLPEASLARWGWALLSWSPSWVGLFSYLVPETILLPLTGASLWMTWRCLRKQSMDSFMAAAVFWLFSCLTKMTVAPWAVISMSALIVPQTQKFRRCLILAGLFLITALPLGYRSFQILGVWAPFGYPMHNRIYMVSGAQTLQLDLQKTGQAPAHYLFTSHSTTVQPLAPLSDWSTSRRGVCNVHVDLDQGARDWKVAFDLNKGTWARRLSLQMENFIFTLWGPSWPDQEPHFWDRLTGLSRWVWAPLLLLVVIGNGLRFKQRSRLGLLPVLTMAGWFFILFQPVAPAEGRYRKPFEGLLIANALWLYSEKNRLKERKGIDKNGAADGYSGVAGSLLEK